MGEFFRARLPKKRILFTCNISNEFFFQNPTMVHKQVLSFNWITGLVIFGEGFNKRELLLLPKLKLFVWPVWLINNELHFLLFKQLKGNTELEQVTQNQGSCWPFRAHLPKNRILFTCTISNEFFFFQNSGHYIGCDNHTQIRIDPVQTKEKIAKNIIWKTKSMFNSASLVYLRCTPPWCINKCYYLIDLLGW